MTTHVSLPRNIQTEIGELILMCLDPQTGEILMPTDEMVQDDFHIPIYVRDNVL